MVALRTFLCVAGCAIVAAQEGYSDNSAQQYVTDAPQEAEETYSPQSEDLSYDAEPMPYFGEKQYFSAEPKPVKCHCDRTAPCWDRETDSCVEAICDGQSEAEFVSSEPASIKDISDPEDPDTIVLNIKIPSVTDSNPHRRLQGYDQEPETEEPQYTTEEEHQLAYQPQYANYDEYNYPKPCMACRCPARTRRCEDFNELRKTGYVFSSLEFAFFFFFACAVLSQACSRAPEQREVPYVASTILTLAWIVAALVFTAAGKTVRCWDDRHFYYVRYIGFILIAPLTLWILKWFGSKGDGKTRTFPFYIYEAKQSRFAHDWELMAFQLLSMLMFGVWLVGGFIESAGKWGLWAAGVILLVVLIFSFEKRVRASPDLVQFRNLARLVWINWVWIALLWLFDEGLGWTSIDLEMSLLFFIDIFWILIFCLVAVYHSEGYKK